ncbi:KinB signaling pathway activation protein [Paenibacillus sp. UNC496MF]|uniref:KinB-signaling pathway activation protein n=1 Tax=Paenibacillus sp. UNC496MF TaxID=1502753 RepID=UPI0008E86FC7|nr:KinB-signaling pathway activation protein [Paenibacillus sp. UNC496MF]SFJ89668.1 KinB signaling pathway activation protein [Paenibacillus sp. UNC496MF]
MNLRKWFFLFWSTAVVGGVVSAVVGTIMQVVDPDFGILGLKATGFNLMTMALVGLLFGVFSQMGFFSYLTLNYIALGVLRKGYLWNALQAYTSLFALGGVGYMLFQNRGELGNGWIFWVLPLALLLASWGVAYTKAKQTNHTAFIPTMFLLIVVTLLEAWQALQSNVSAMTFMVIPMFVCNAYQILWLHRLLRKEQTTGSASSSNAKPVA